MRKIPLLIGALLLLIVVSTPAHATLSTPTIQTTNTTLGTTASATATINMPTGILAGELIIVILRTALAGVHGYPANWVKQADSTTDAADDEISIAYYIVTTVPGSTISVSQGNAKYAAIAYRISGEALVSPIQLSAETVGTSTLPDPASLTATNGANNYMWLWLGGWAGEQTSPPASTPTSYTNALGADSGTAGATTTNVRVASARRALNAATENPASWTISVSDSWTAWTLLVVPGTTASIAQSITLASAKTNIANHPRSLAQSITIASALTKIANHPRALAQSITIASSLTKTAKHFYSLSQSITMSSTVAKIKGFVIGLAQSITSSGALSKIVHYLDSLTQSITNLGTLTKTNHYLDSLSQSITISEALSKTNQYFDSLTQSIIIAINNSNSNALYQTGDGMLTCTFSFAGAGNCNADLSQFIQDRQDAIGSFAHYTSDGLSCLMRFKTLFTSLPPKVCSAGLAQNIAVNAISATSKGYSIILSGAIGVVSIIATALSFFIILTGSIDITAIVELLRTPGELSNVIGFVIILIVVIGILLYFLFGKRRKRRYRRRR